MFAIDRDDNITAIPVGADIVRDDDMQYFGSRRELSDIVLSSPGERSVSIWNSIPGVTPIKTKKFRNRGTAIERIWSKLCKLWPDALEPKKARAMSATRGKRDSSKRDAVIALIQRPGGASISEIMQSTGWQAHSVRGFLSTSAKKLNLDIQSDKNAAGERVYRVA